MPQGSVNQDALNDAYELFKENGYTKDVNEFQKLISTNSDALNDAYTLFKENGYQKSIDDFSTLLGVKKSTPPQGGISSKGSLSSTPILKTGSSGSTGLKSQSNVAKTDFSQGALNFQQAYAKQVADKTGTSTAPKFKTYSVIDQSKEAKAARVQENKKAEELVSKIAIDEANAKKQNKEASAYDYLLSGLGDVAGAFATTMTSGGNNPMYGGYAPNDKVTTKEDLQKAARLGNAVSESIGANARENIEQSGNVNEGNPLKSFQEDGILGGVAQTAKSIVGSAPAMIAMMNPASLASYAVGSIGRETDKLEKEGVPSDKALLSATTKIGADIALERLFGGAKILKNIIAKSGKAAAKETLKKAIIKNIGQNASEEGVAQLIQNASQIYIEDKKDIGLLDNVPNSVIIGGASGSFFTPLVILQKNAEKAIEEKAKQDEDNLRQEQLGMAYENNKQEELKEQQLNQQYNESKSSGENQTIESGNEQSGIVSEGQGDRQIKGVQRELPSGQKIGQNASDENGTQEITTDAIQEPSPESEVSRIGEGGENTEIDSTRVRPINEGEKVTEEVTQEEVTPIGNEVVESVVTGQKPIADLTENELSSASESIADDISKANSKQQEIATDIKKAHYDSIKAKIDNIKEAIIRTPKDATMLQQAKAELKALNKQSADLAKWLVKNNYGVQDKSITDMINRNKAITDLEINTIIKKLSNGLITKEKLESFKQKIKDSKTDKAELIKDFFQSINPASKLSTRQVNSLLKKANDGTYDAFFKQLLSVANSVNKSELTANFNDVKKQIKSIKHTMVKNNIALGNAIAGIKNLPEVFKKDFVADVNRLLDTYKMYNQFDTKLANEIIDKYKPIEEQFAVEKQREKTYRIFEENKLYGARDISEFTQEEIEDAVADFLAKEQPTSKEELDKTIEPTEAEKQKEMADAFAEEFHATINDLLDLFDYEVLQGFKGITASEISTALILKNDKFNKQYAKKLNEVAQNLYNGDTESSISILTALAKQIKAKKENLDGVPFDKVNMPEKGQKYKGFWNGVDNILKSNILQSLKGLDTLILQITGNNVSKANKLQEGIGRGLEFKNISDMLIGINSTFEDTLSDINKKAKYLFTRDVNARKNQTTLRILSQVKQIKVNLDADEQVQAVVKRIQEVLVSKSRIEKMASKTGSFGDSNNVQELDAHNDFLKKIEGIGIKTDGSTVTEFPFEDFASFEKAINSIQEYKAHNDTLSEIVKYLQEQGYSETMEKHSIRDNGITLERYTNYIPLFYQRAGSTEDGTQVMPGANLTPDVASAVKQRRGLGADQYLAGDFLTGLTNVHNQSMADAMMYEQNLIADAAMNSKYLVDALNFKVNDSELKYYNQGVAIRGSLKNIYSNQFTVQKYGSRKDATGKTPVVDAIASVIGKSNTIALMKVTMLITQSLSQSVVVMSSLAKIKATGRDIFAKNSTPILPKDMPYSDRGRVAKLAGLGDIINESIELATNLSDSKLSIGSSNKIINKAKVVEKVGTQTATTVAKWNTAGADFMSRSFMFYTWVQAMANKAGMDIAAPDFWSKIEQGMINNDIEILKITQRAKDEANVQGNLNKSFGSNLTTSNRGINKLFKVMFANMKGFSMLQYQAYMNKRRILFNSENSKEERLAAGIDIFGLHAAAGAYGMAQLFMLTAGSQDEIKNMVADAFKEIVGGGSDEDEKIEKLTKENRNIAIKPTMGDYGFVASLSMFNMLVPETPIANTAIKTGLNQAGLYEGAYKQINKAYNYFAGNEELYPGEDKFKSREAMRMMSKGILPYQDESYLGIQEIKIFELLENTITSLYAVTMNDDINDSAKRQYKKASFAAIAKLAPYVPIVNSGYGFLNIFGVDKAVDNVYKESVKNAEAIAGIDKNGVQKFNKQYVGNAIKLLDKEVKAKLFAKESVGTAREVFEKGKDYSKIKNAPQNAIVRDILKKLGK